MHVRKFGLEGEQQDLSDAGEAPKRGQKGEAGSA